MATEFLIVSYLYAVGGAFYKIMIRFDRKNSFSGPTPLAVLRMKCGV